MIEALIDTNVVVDWLKAVPEAQEELLAYKRRYLSRVAWIEFLVGVPPGDAQVAVQALSAFTLIEITEPVARRTVLIRQQFRRLKLPDAMIYATAQVHGLTLVTRNLRDFNEDMPGVRIPYSV